MTESLISNYTCASNVTCNFSPLSWIHFSFETGLSATWRMGRKKGKRGLRKEMSSLSRYISSAIRLQDQEKGGQTSCMKCKDGSGGKAMMNRSISWGRKWNSVYTSFRPSFHGMFSITRSSHCDIFGERDFCDEPIPGKLFSSTWCLLERGTFVTIANEVVLKQKKRS